MKDINERLFKLRKEVLGLSRRAFGEPLAYTDSMIKNLDEGKTDPKPEFLALVSRIYNVSLEWLQTGEGEMFSPRTEDEELAVLFGEVLSDDCSPERRRIIRAIMVLLSEIPDEMLPVIGQHFRTIADACDNKEE